MMFYTLKSWLQAMHWQRWSLRWIYIFFTCGKWSQITPITFPEKMSQLSDFFVLHLFLDPYMVGILQFCIQSNYIHHFQFWISSRVPENFISIMEENLQYFQIQSKLSTKSSWKQRSVIIRTRSITEHE